MPEPLSLFLFFQCLWVLYLAGDLGLDAPITHKRRVAVLFWLFVFTISVLYVLVPVLDIRAKDRGPQNAVRVAQ